MNLHDLTRYANAVARDATMTKPHLREDAAQEGLIGGWQATVDKPDASPAYVKKAARNAVSDAVVRGRSTGSERGKGTAGADAYATDRTSALMTDGLHGRPHFVVEPEDDSVFLDLFRVEISDLRARIRRAVRALDEEDRLHVYLRFWEGRTARQIAEEIGKTESYVAGRWNAKIRPALRSQLTEGLPA